MIRIDRTTTGSPASLVRNGAAELSRIEGIIQRGELRSSDFPKRLYSSAEVRDALWSMQHQKCCFCEREYERSFSTVEHFRPKARAVREDGRNEIGYWWLAYEFENLYFACQSCNNSKRDHFPLQPGAPPLRYPDKPWSSREAALLLDPGYDDPEEHLTFVEMPNGRIQIAPREGSEWGRTTIRVAALDRDDLTELRGKYHRDVLVPILRRFDSARTRSDQTAMNEAREDARQSCLPHRCFALLARFVFRTKGLI